MTTPRAIWCREDTICGPSELGSGAGDTLRPSESLIPIDGAHSLALIRNENIAASIPLLFFACCPPAIMGAVSGIIVDSFKAMSRRGSSAHISNEVLKLTPRRADCDASATVDGIGLIRRVLATLNHRVPHHVFGSLARCWIVPMLCPQFFAEAPATARRSCRELVSWNGLTGAAVADAGPSEFAGTAGFRVEADNGEASEAPAPKVFRVAVEDNVFSHAACSFQQRVWLGVVGRFQRLATLPSIISLVPAQAARNYAS